MNSIHNKYMMRNTRYMANDGVVMLVEKTRPGIVTLDEWEKVVFLSSDGQHTVGEFIAQLGKEYQDGPPPGFPNQVTTMILDLCGRGYLLLLDKKKPLPYYLDLPVSEQDSDRAKELMIQDGFIKLGSA